MKILIILSLTLLLTIYAYSIPTVSDISTICITQLPSQSSGFEYRGEFSVKLDNFTLSDNSVFNLNTDSTKPEYFDKKHNQAYMVFTMYLNQNDYWNQTEFKKRLVANITESIKAKYAKKKK